MKKLYVLKHLFLVVSLMLFLHSCKKDNVNVVVKDQPSTQSLVNIVKSSLEKQSVAGSPMISSLKSIGLTPDWSNVKTRINSKNKTVLAIPLEKTISSFSELNVIITNGIPNEVIKKYTVAEDKTILLEFYALNGNLLKTGRYNPATRKFLESKSLLNKVSLYENLKSGFRSNGNVLLLLSNNNVKMSSKDRAIAGINEPKKPTDTPDLGIPLDEVDIVTEGPKKPDVPDPLGPPSPDPNTVDSWPIEPINEAGGASETTDPANSFVDKIDDTKLKDCFKKVVENIKTIDKACFPNMVKVFAGTTPGYNWKMQDGYSGGNNGDTNSIYDKTSQSVTSTFDSNLFKGGSDLAIAKTILHESIYAYLVAYFAKDALSANITYSDLVTKWETSHDLNGIQHDVIVNRLIGSVASNLINYGKNQGYNLQDQFYYDLSWGGLQNTSAFKNFSPDVQKRILNVIKIEQSGIDTDGNQSKPKGNTSGGC
ncbi:hypothetical protein [Pedobacter cryoconitis]|nr:hypothetical protein [Pedobacter cryoconitis]